MHNPTFYSRREYLEALVARISELTAGSRVTVSTLSFKPEEPAIRRLVDTLCAAAERGVQVNLMVDAYIFLVNKHAIPGPLFFKRQLSRRLPKLYHRRLAALQELEASGGTYTITNWPTRRFTNPFSGRSHIKFAVIDDYVLVGGCNLTLAAETDCMVGWVDAKTADWLATFAADVRSQGSPLKVLRGVDVSFALSDTAALLIDSGKPGQSLIFDTALALIDAAEEYILLTCQYFPNDATSRHLAAAAKRGVQVDIVYNHPLKHPFPHTVLHRGVEWTEKRRLPASFFAHRLLKKNEYMHAKILVTDKGAIVGSHNYVNAGVRFGTAEIALLSHDVSFGEQAIQMLEAQIRE